MIVPSQRLLHAAVLPALPLFTLAVMALPLFTPAACALLIVLAGVIVIDAIWAQACLRDVCLELPPLQRLVVDHDSELWLQLAATRRSRGRSLSVALALPGSFTAEPLPRRITAPAASSQIAKFAWPLTPRQRGAFTISQAAVQGLSPLGFFLVRRRLPVHCRLQVYPDLSRERQRLAGLFMHRGSSGLQLQRQLGRGREFEKLREYIPGDSFDTIHWKATAKRNQLITKEFQLEHTQEVYVVLDYSRLSARPPQMHDAAANAKPILETYLTASLVLAQVAEQQNDQFGLVTFADQLQTMLRASRGQIHYRLCRDALYQLQPQLVSPDYLEVASQLVTRLRRRSLIVFLTNLDDPVLAEQFTAAMQVVQRRHLILLAMPQPSGMQPLFSADAAAPAASADIYAKLAQHLQWRQLLQLRQKLTSCGMHMALLPAEQLATGLVSRYLAIKRRQIL